MKSAVRGGGPALHSRPGAAPAERAAVRPLPTASLRIGPLELDGRWVLAPLAGVSDWPFRVLAREQGAALAYTEMVSTEGLTRGGAKTIKYLERAEGERPFAVQLFGADPATMAEAAAMVEAEGAELIDVNMGCPVKKVCRTGAGSALLREPSAVGALVEAMTRAVSVPLQIKVRTGWDDESVNVLEVARVAREAGATAIAIHGRTRAQAYSGRADWTVIAEVKSRFPDLVVIGNGDIVTAEDALSRLASSGVDAVMVGRGACGYPWIFREIRALAAGRPIPPPPTYEEWREMISRHLTNLVVYRGGDARRASREFRKHLCWYSRGRRGAAAFRSELASLESPDAVERCLDRHFPATRHHELRRDAELVTGPLARAWG